MNELTWFVGGMVLYVGLLTMGAIITVVVTVAVWLWKEKAGQQ